jgi:hypothetical protein
MMQIKLKTFSYSDHVYANINIFADVVIVEVFRSVGSIREHSNLRCNRDFV